MNGPALAREDRRTWTLAGGLALAAHVAVGALALAWVRPTEAPPPEPVVLVELPPETAPAPSAAAPQPTAQPQPDYAPPQTLTPPIELPPVRAPLPANPVTLPPPPPPAPARAANPAPVPAPVVSVAAPAAASAASASADPGADARAKRQEADYFSLVSAHLNRRKIYPPEARQARQQGVVTVRFTVDRSGGVSGVAIKRSSGHDLLDRATLDLLQRVAPLPRMPASMRRDSVTLSLPIDYSLRTS